MEKIRVTAVINDLLLGGSQSILINILRRIDKERFAVETCYIYDYAASGRSNFEKEFAEAAPLINLGRGRKPHILTAFWRLYRHFRKTKPDIVQCYLPDSVIAGVLAARLAGVKKIVIHEQNTHKFYSWKIEWLFRIARHFADLTITYSESLEKELFGDFLILEAPIGTVSRSSYTIQNGIDLDKVDYVFKSINQSKKRAELGLRDDHVVVFCAARLVDWKGYEYLLRALPDVVKKFSNVAVLIAGDGPEEKKLQALISELHLESFVRLLGARTDVFEILACTDIYPQAYAYPDGFSSISVGMAGMEAMAFRLPVIASRYPALYEGLHSGKNLMLVKPRDVEGIAEALLFLLQNPEERKKIGEAARTFVEERFSSKKIIKIYESIYEALLAKSRI